MRSQEEITAYHEAAHVVVAMVLRKKFSYVSLHKRGDSFGRVMWGGFNHDTYKEWKSIRLMTILFAGPYMESQLDVKDLKSCSGDFDVIYEIAKQWNFDDKVEDKCQEASIELVCSHLGAIVEVAKELYKTKRLNYFQAREIVKANTELPSYKTVRGILSRAQTL